MPTICFSSGYNDRQPTPFQVQPNGNGEDYLNPRFLCILSEDTDIISLNCNMYAAKLSSRRLLGTTYTAIVILHLSKYLFQNIYSLDTSVFFVEATESSAVGNCMSLEALEISAIIAGNFTPQWTKI